MFDGATDMASYGLLAVGTGGCRNIEFSASQVATGGRMRSNADIKIWGSSVEVDGPVSYGGTTNLPAAPNVTHDTTITVADLGFEVDDFAAGLADFSTPFHVHPHDFQTSAAVDEGVHYVVGDVNISGSSVDLTGVTIVATGRINLSGSSIDLSPADPGLPTLVSGSDACNHKAAINISASSLLWDGTIVAVDGMVRVSASTVRGGDVVAAAVRGSASSLELD